MIFRYIKNNLLDLELESNNSDLSQNGFFLYIDEKFIIIRFS